MAGHILEARLIKLDRKDFDVILDMDWLVENQVTIDCAKKEVCFWLTSGANFKFKGTKREGLKVIFGLKVKHLLQHGAWAYVAKCCGQK